MLAVNYSTLRNNLKAYCDKATDESETVIVTRKNEKNVVIMSLEKYNNLRENLFLKMPLLVLTRPIRLRHIGLIKTILI